MTRSPRRTDLSTFTNDWFQPGASAPVRALWYVVNALLFDSPWFPIYAPKRQLLRWFGAKVGEGVVIKPSVNIKFPWKLEIGDYSWIGEGVWIDNLARVSIGDHACLSQGALLLCGNHDYTRSTFDLIVKEITVGEGAWIGARATVVGGVSVGSHAVLTAGSVAVRSVEAWAIHQGNPATLTRNREIAS